MGSAVMTERPRAGTPTASRRFGYLMAIAVNAVLLYVAHQLLDWKWPGFLTAEFDDVLPIVSVSFVATILTNAVFFWYDADWFKSLGGMVTSAIGFVVAVRMLQVFPFDFSTYDVNWSWLAKLVIVVAIAGTAIGFVANSVTLVTVPLKHNQRERH